MTMSLCIAFMLHPRATNSDASQSSSSGWLGGDPCVPKSLSVSTRPRPKYSCHMRLTATRAVSGFFGSTIHFARSSRVYLSFGRQRRQHGRHARRHQGALAEEVAALVDVRLARRRALPDDQRRRDDGQVLFQLRDLLFQVAAGVEHPEMDRRGQRIDAAQRGDDVPRLVGLAVGVQHQLLLLRVAAVDGDGEDRPHLLRQVGLVLRRQRPLPRRQLLRRHGVQLFRAAFPRASIFACTSARFAVCSGVGSSSFGSSTLLKKANSS